MPFRILLELVKIRVSGASAFTVLAGHVACARGFRTGALTALAGTLLMSMGACALNEVQERIPDGHMARTHQRPLPAGRVRPWVAVLLAVLLAASGFLLLWGTHGRTPALLGALALVWYNAVYTPLKRRTPFAAVPGSLIGALPPAMGWTAAGGHLLDPPLLALAGFMFLWQVPHFWLLFWRHQEDYEAAGFPSLGRHFSRPQLARLTFAWIGVTALAAPALPLLGLVRSLPAVLVLGAAAVWTVWRASGLLAAVPDVRRVFLHVNLFTLLVVLALILDPLLAA